MAVARPTSDISIGAWRDQSGGFIDLFAAIGEASLNLATYAQVVSTPLAGDPDLPATFGLSTAPTLGSGERFRVWLYASAAYSSGAARHLRLELLDGGTVRDSATISVSNASPARFGYTVAAGLTSLSSPQLRLSLMHDGTLWQALVYQAILGSVFSHLAPGPGGVPQLQTAESGSCLAMGSGGVPVVLGSTEDETNLVMSTDGVPKGHG